MIKKCECYHTKATFKPYSRDTFYADVVGVCWGTKERDECSCGGDRAKCDFYPEYREQSKTEKRVAREILSLIKTICFSEDYLEHRIRYGSNGMRDLIIAEIKTMYGLK